MMIGRRRQTSRCWYKSALMLTRVVVVALETLVTLLRISHVLRAQAAIFKYEFCAKSGCQVLLLVA